jgi:hypothetical protein
VEATVYSRMKGGVAGQARDESRSARRHALSSRMVSPLRNGFPMMWNASAANLSVWPRAIFLTVIVERD